MVAGRVRCLGWVLVVFAMVAQVYVPSIGAAPRDAGVAPEAPVPSAESLKAHDDDVAKSEAMQRPPGPAPVGEAPRPAVARGSNMSALSPNAPIAPDGWISDEEAIATLGDPPALAPDDLPAVDGLPAGFDEVLSVEDLEARSEYTASFENADGSTTLESSMDRIHFRDGSGWEKIDNTLYIRDDGSITNGANDWSVSFEDSSAGVAMSTSAGVFGWRARDTNAVVPVIEPDGVSVRYVEMWPGVDVVYRVSGGKVEEFIEIKRATARSSFAFDLDGMSLDAKTEDGWVAEGALGEIGVRLLPAITFDGAGAVVDVEAGVTLEVSDAAGDVVVPAVTAEGARGVGDEVAGKPAGADAGAVADTGVVADTGLAADVGAVADAGVVADAAVVADAGEVIEVTVDPEWLADLDPDRFPVRVDPTFTVGPTSGWLRAVNNTGGFYNDLSIVGHNGSNSIWRTLVQFPYAQAVGAGNKVTAVDFFTKTTGESQDTREFNIRHALEWNFDAIEPPWV